MTTGEGEVEADESFGRYSSGLIELRTKSLRAVIDRGRGGDVLFVGPPGGPNALFHEAWDTPQPAGGSTSYGSATLDWLSHYRGGWQVMFPNAGAECTVDGQKHPVHGEVSSAPAEVLEWSATEVVLRTATRLGLTLERRISLAPARPVLLVEERVENESNRPLSYVWGHHPAITASPGMRIDIPVGRLHVDDAFDDPVADLKPGAVGMWPNAELRTGGVEALDQIPAKAFERVCYLPDRPAGWAAVREPVSGRGVAPRLGHRRVPAPLAVAADERPAVPVPRSGPADRDRAGILLARRRPRPRHRTRPGPGDRAACQRDRLDHAVPVRSNDRRDHQRQTGRFGLDGRRDRGMKR